MVGCRYPEYYSLFVSAGYDLQTITRMTPEDFTAVGRWLERLLVIGSWKIPVVEQSVSGFDVGILVPVLVPYFFI